MIYCLINEGSFHGNSMKINYSLINDSEDFRVNKVFKMDFSDSNIVYFRFSKSQFKENKIENFIKEISSDFIRSKYILGREDFEKYFLKIDVLDDIKDIFKTKYLKLNQAVERIRYLKYVLL